MLLSDLFEEKYLPMSRVKPKTKLTRDVRPSIGLIPMIQVDSLSSVRELGDGLERGTGVQAKVFAHPSKGRTVVKYAKIQSPYKSDSYLGFLNVVLHNQDNPFFPAVDSAKIYYEDMSRDAVLVMSLEELDGMMDSNYVEDAIESCEPNYKYLRKIYGINEYGDLVEKRTTNDKLQSPSTKEILEGMHEQLFELFKSDMIEYAFNNKNFIDACRKMKSLKEKYGGDLHTGNVMIRPYKGTQLVFIDPFLPFKMRPGRVDRNATLDKTLSDDAIERLVDKLIHNHRFENAIGMSLKDMDTEDQLAELSMKNHKNSKTYKKLFHMVEVSGDFNRLFASVKKSRPLTVRMRFGEESLKHSDYLAFKLIQEIFDTYKDEVGLE